MSGARTLTIALAALLAACAGARGAPEPDLARFDPATALTLSLQYRSEVYHSFSGALDRPGASQYAGLLDLFVHLDTQKARLWPGGNVLLNLENGHGRGLIPIGAPYAGPLTSIDARPFTRLVQLYLDQSLLEGRVRIKLGRQDANADFNALSYAADFLYPTYTLNPTIPLPTFPEPGTGVSVFVTPVDSLSLRLGAYHSAVPAPEGNFYVFQPTWQPKWGAHGHYPGTYGLGVWYHTGRYPAVSAAPTPRTHRGNHGVYLLLQQRVYKENADPQDAQGLGVFAEYGWTPPDRNQLTQSVAVGLSYTGLVPGRDADELALGLSRARLSGRVRGAVPNLNQTEAELFYRAVLTPHLTVQPDVQYLDNPAAGIHHALALGVRAIASF